MLDRDQVAEYMTPWHILLWSQLYKIQSRQDVTHT